MAHLINFINRSTKVTAINEDGEVYKVLPNAKVNFLQDIEALKKQTAMSIRLHKDEPIHVVEKIVMKCGGEDVVLAPSILDELKSGKRPLEFSSASEKFNITIYIKAGAVAQQKQAPKTPTHKTMSSRKLSQENQENANNENNSTVPEVATEKPTPSVHPPSPARLRPTSSHPASPSRVRPGSATRRKNVQSPAVTRRVGQGSMQTPLHAPTTSKAPAASHNRMSPKAEEDTRTEKIIPATSSAPSFPAVSADETPAPQPAATQTPAAAASDDVVNEHDISMTWKDIYSPMQTENNNNVDNSLVNDGDEKDCGECEDENDSTKVPGKSNTPLKIRHTKKSSTAVKSAQERSLMASEPDFMYPEGRTAAEVAQTFTSNMRSYNDGAAKSATKKPAPSNTPNKSKKGSTAFHTSSSSSSSDPEGRPSLGTLTMQWQFMRDNFLKGNEEELEWLMVSKNQGAYKHAHKKYCAAEDKYYRSLCETEVYENLMNIAMSDGRKLHGLLSSGAAIHLSLQVNPGSEEFLEQALAMQKSIKAMLNMSTSSVSSLMNCFCANTQKILKQFMDETNRVRIARTANSLEKLINDELKEIPSKLVTARKDGDDALQDMEKWSKREVETNDYAEAMKAAETEWFQKEYEANIVAYRAMRSLIPLNITELTVDAMHSLAVANNGLYSLELIQELKRNKLLHWLVMHKDDIAMSNFLVGEFKAYFENIEGYDIVELRALCLCLPDKFELDGDGKKAEWRARLLNRTKLLASQQNRELVKGAWDYAAGKRSMVALPALKAEQERRPIYFFRTKQQAELRLKKQYTEKEALLEKKKVLLQKAETETIEAKREYDTLLVEMRDPEFKAVYGNDKLLALKEVAKTEWATCDKKRKALEKDVNSIQAAINENPMSKDQFIASNEELSIFLAAKGIDWTNSQTPVQIVGMFSADTEIRKVERAAAKFLSAEEEAGLRKAELNGLMRKEKCEVAPEEVLLEANEEESNANAPITPARVRLTHFQASARQDDEQLNAAVDDEDLCKGNQTSFTPGRRGSILQSANKDMLACLNKMFSSKTEVQPAPRTPSARMSMIGGHATTPSALNRRTTVACGSLDDDTAPFSIETVAKRTQSKLLKRALESFQKSKPAEEEVPASAPQKPMLSFLDQIKAGKAKSKAATAPETALEDEKPAPKPMNPLAMLGKTGASFLDAIKSRRVE